MPKRPREDRDDGTDSGNGPEDGDEAQVGRDRDTGKLARAMAEPLVPGKKNTYWRDVNVEIVKIAEAFEGTPEGKKMKELRQRSHERNLGQFRFVVQIGEDLLDLKKGDSDETILAKVVAFIKDVKENNPEKFPEPIEEAVSADEAKNMVFWRDITASIDSLRSKFPDKKYPEMRQLREIFEAGDVGKGMHLLMTVEGVHLWVKKTDDNETIKKKMMIFIGELKQIADANKKSKETFDEKQDKVYWRDIEAAISSLDEVYGSHPDFKMLKLSIEEGVLGTVKDFHARIDGIELTISPVDSDAEMKDKLTRFIKDLTKTGSVKFDKAVYEKFRKLEGRYQQLEEEHLDLESRYKTQGGDLKEQSREIRRLESENDRYQREITKLKRDLADAQRGSSSGGGGGSFYTTRSYSG